MRADLDELRDTIAAIRRGDVDGVLVGPGRNQRVYTRTDTDQPLRALLDMMRDGAATVSADGLVLYANRRLASYVGQNPAELIGNPLRAVVAPDRRSMLDQLLDVAPGRTAHCDLALDRRVGTPRSVAVSATALVIDDLVVRCLVFRDRRRDR